MGQEFCPDRTSKNTQILKEYKSFWEQKREKN